MSELRKGDKVLVKQNATATARHYRGQTATYTGSTCFFTVGTVEFPMTEEEYERIEDMDTKFKVGDTVYVNVDGLDYPRTIVKANKQGGSDTYTVQDKTGYTGSHWWHNNELTLIKGVDEMETKFKVGDRVVDNNGEHEREIVAVEKVTRYRVSDKYDETDDERWMTEDSVANWSLVPEQTEVTLEQIAEKFSIPVSKLRIKE